RPMWFVTLVLRNLWHRKVRTALTCLGMGVAVCAVVTMFGVADVFEQAVVKMYNTRDVDIVVTRAGVAQIVAGKIDDAPYRDRLKAISGVVGVEPMLIDVINFKEPRLDAVYVMGWEPGGRMSEHFHFVSGRELSPDDNDKLIMGTLLARNLGK